MNASYDDYPGNTLFFYLSTHPSKLMTQPQLWNQNGFDHYSNSSLCDAFLTDGRCPDETASTSRVIPSNPGYARRAHECSFVSGYDLQSVRALDLYDIDEHWHTLILTEEGAMMTTRTRCNLSFFFPLLERPPTWSYNSGN